MKTKSVVFYSIVFASIIISCKKKDDTSPTSVNQTPSSDNYSSVNAFFSKNAPVMQTYTINAGTGGSFTSPQGTMVNIPANAFTTKQGVAVTGNVTIQFKDLYKKSDMLLSGMPTIMTNGAPLKSSGEFFIKALSSNNAIILALGKTITVTQPASLTGGVDAANPAIAFVGIDTIGAGGNNITWTPTNIDSVNAITNQYVFNLYQFNSPVDSGSWCNSDNSSYFSAYPQTSLTLKSTDSVNIYDTQVFLVFKNISSMVHVYSNGAFDFPYYYAPQGLQCTAVAVGVKKGQLYSAFVPITIGYNQIVNFTLSATTTSSFTATLHSID